MSKSLVRNTMWALAATAVVTVGVGAAAARAQTAPVDQSESDLAWLSARGEFLLAWVEDTGAGPRILAKRVRANGLPVAGATARGWEATRHAAGAPLGEQRWPAVIDGVLVYAERAPGAPDFDLYAQRLFDNGRPSGLPWPVVERVGDQRTPDVAAIPRDRGEDYLIVWSEDTRDTGDVMGVRVDYAFRRSRGAPFAIAEGPSTAEDPVLVRDPVEGDDLLVVFTDDQSGNRDIYGARIVDSGLPRGGPTAAPFPVVESPEDDYAPGIDAAVDGVGPRAQANHLLVFTRDSVTGGPDVMGLRVQRNGLPKGAPFALVDGAGGQGAPALALRRAARGRRTQADEFLMTWTDDALGNLDVKGLRLGRQGQVLTHDRWLVRD